MNDKKTVALLKWVLFFVGIGTLVASGIYLHVAISDGFGFRGLIKAVAFLVVGMLTVAMYGQKS